MWSLQMSHLSPAPRCSPLLANTVHGRSTGLWPAPAPKCDDLSWSEYCRVNPGLCLLYLCFELSGKSRVYPLPKPGAGQWAAAQAQAGPRSSPRFVPAPSPSAELWLPIIQILEPFINKAHNGSGMRALLSTLPGINFGLRSLVPWPAVWSLQQNAKREGMGINSSRVKCILPCLQLARKLRLCVSAKFRTSGSVCSAFFHEQNEILNWTLW